MFGEIDVFEWRQCDFAWQRVIGLQDVCIQSEGAVVGDDGKIQIVRFSKADCLLMLKCADARAEGPRAGGHAGGVATV